MDNHQTTIAERVSALEELTVDILAGMVGITQPQYLDTPRPKDPLCQAWRACLGTLGRLGIQLERLHNLAREQTGAAQLSETMHSAATGDCSDDAAEHDGSATQVEPPAW